MFNLFPAQSYASLITDSSVTEPPYVETEAEIQDKAQSQEAAIVGELTDQRTENAKYFIKADQSVEANIFSVPVHYLKDGQWEDIDNTLVESQDEEKTSVFENKSNAYKIKIAKKADAKKLASIQKDNYEVSWNLDGVQKINSALKAADTAALSQLSSNDQKRTLTKLSSEVNFKEVYPGVDLQYLTTPDSLKENLILNSLPTQQSFIFNLNVKGLIPKLLEDQRIVFYDEKDPNRAVFQFDAPYMFDANNEQSTNIKVTLKSVGKQYQLTLEPDQKWLADQNRMFPVILDPTLQTKLETNSITDNHVTSGLPNSNFETSYMLKTGNSTGGVHRTYIKFELPPLTSSDMIIDAELFMNLLTSKSSAQQVNVHKVLSGPTDNWTASGITWNSKPNFDSKVVDFQFVQSINVPYHWNVTSIVRDWYTTGNNNGLMLKNNDESLTTGYTEYISANTSAAYTNLRATILLTYVNYSGLEDYWTYHSQDVGRAGTGYVNDYNGNLVFIHNDLAMSGNRMPLTLNHVYNSNYKNNDGKDDENDDEEDALKYGPGWRLNLNQRIHEKPIGSTLYYVYTDGDGTKHYFKYVAERGAIVDELNPTEYTLTKNPDNSYVIKDKKNNRLDFVAGGFLLSITDANDNSLRLSYNGTTLKTITDGAGRVTTLDVTPEGYLIGVIDPANRRTSFSYNGIKLETITYPDGTTTKYTYDSANTLTSAMYNNGYKIVYDYYPTAPNRVKRILETHYNGTLGNELNIEYGYNTTFFTDLKGRKNTYQFNSSGNTIGIKDADGNAQYQDFEKDINVNKLSLESKLQKTVINSLKNHNVETTGSWTADYWTGSTGSSGIAAEAANANIGKQSLKVTKTNTIARQFQNQTLTLEKGKTYTFSSYVKTSGVTSDNQKGAALFVNYQNSAGTFITKESGYLNGSKDFSRLEIPFTLPADASSTTVYVRAGLIEESGTAYFDNLQLEEGTLANRYNLLENNSFEFDTGVPSFWTIGGTYDANDTSVTTEKAFGSRSVRMNGIADKTKYYSQTVNVAGNTDDVLVVGGWGKGSSVSLSNGTGRYFALDIGINLDNGTTQWEVVQFNEDSLDWQYASKRFIAKGPYHSVTYYLLYYNEANSAYFDGLQLYKEQFGQSYKYDTNGNVVSAIDLANQESKFKYTGNNDIETITDPKGSQFQYTYDGKHNVETATSAENVLYSFEYDDYGNPETSKVGGAVFSQTTATYTGNYNYLETLTDSEGNKVTYGYDNAVNPNDPLNKGNLTSVKDAKGQVTSYDYNPNNDQLRSVSAPVDGQNVSNSYTYENDRIKTIKQNGDQVIYTFDYDSLGNNTSVKVGNQTQTQTLVTNTFETYNQRKTGTLLESTYGNGFKIGFDYDLLNRVTAKKYNGNVKFKYQYDGSGNLGYAEDLINEVNYRYVYDLADRLVQVKDSKGNSKTYGYDNNNQSKFTEVIGGVTYTTDYVYDKDNRLKEVNYSRPGQSGIKISFAYDTIGRLDSKTITIGGVTRTTSYVYKPGNNNSTTSKIEKETINGKDIRYGYDKNGNISDITYSDGKTIHYDYDELNELKRENNQVTNSTVVYSYDVGGNISKKKIYPYTAATVETIDLGAPTSIIDYAYGDANWKDKLTIYDNKTITYDTIGNPKTYDGWTYTWEAGRQLASMVKGSTSLSFKYNDEGIRTQKTVNNVTTNYTLNGDKVTLEERGTDKIYYSYDSAGDLVSMNLNGAEYFYIRNAQGDITGLWDKNGTEVVSYTYDSWGKMISITGSKAGDVGEKNPYRYRGYRYDSETKLYYLQSRYYDPDWGRFINADALGGEVGKLLSHNVFAYCLNNPVNMADPNGNIAWWVVGGAIGAVAGAAYSYVKTGSVDWRYVVGGALIGAGLGFLSQTAYVAYSTNVVASSTALTIAQKSADKVSRTSSKPAGNVDFYATSSGEVLPATKKGIDAALSRMQQVGDKFVGEDTLGPLRVRIEQHFEKLNFTGKLDPYHTVPHIHVDRRLNAISGKWVKTLTLPIEIFK